MINLKRFDPTDSNAAMKAAERANELEGALLDLITAIKDSHNLPPVTVESALRWAEFVIEGGESVRIS